MIFTTEQTLSRTLFNTAKSRCYLQLWFLPLSERFHAHCFQYIGKYVFHHCCSYCNLMSKGMVGDIDLPQILSHFSDKSPDRESMDRQCDSPSCSPQDHPSYPLYSHESEKKCDWSWNIEVEISHGGEYVTGICTNQSFDTDSAEGNLL